MKTIARFRNADQTLTIAQRPASPALAWKADAKTTRRIRGARLFAQASLHVVAPRCLMWVVVESVMSADAANMDDRTE